MFDVTFSSCGATGLIDTSLTTPLFESMHGASSGKDIETIRARNTQSEGLADPKK
jgi:hypothetical protein